MAKLVLVGDVMIGRSFNQLFSQYPDFNIWGDTLPLLRRADLVMINLETTLTDSNEKWPDKTFNYQLFPKYSKVLKEAHVDFANLANNHILDYQQEGLVDTLNTLDKLSIAHTGAGSNLTEAQRFVIFHLPKLKVGIFSAADHYNYWAAGGNKAGINYINIEDPNSWTDVFKVLSELRPLVDIVIFSIHHGSNYVDTVPSSTVELFHRLIEQGVDIIHGHSAHHPLPIEIYHPFEQKSNRFGLIFYGMGDFVDDYAVSDQYRNDLSFIAEIDLGSLGFTVYPTKISNFQVNLLPTDSPEYLSVIDRLTAKV